MASITMDISLSLGWRLTPCIKAANVAMHMRLRRLAVWLLNAGLRGTRWRIGKGKWERFAPPLRITLGEVE
jgi:hypothetical protein